MFPQVINFVSELNLLNENFSIKQDLCFYEDYSFLAYLFNFSDYGLLNSAPKSAHIKSLVAFINQTEDINLCNNLENVTAVYHYSIPNTKLAYPEPFIAAPSFMHSDLWFVHILVYQYWLWFVFVFIIVFFFLTFLCTIRWCNMRVRPRRETRGVSRSKCGDLVTACVPVSWATSIIVNESTDAIDYYDGFGTTELVVGIRAYQWGWEYYYPKDIDLNYNIKQNYSTFVGNSLKYDKSTSAVLRANNMWKFYQNKTYDQVVTPAYLLALPADNLKLLNFLNFNDIGSNSAIEANAFKKVRMFSKTFTSNLTFVPNDYSIKYKFMSNLYSSDNLFTDSNFHGLRRQQNFLSTSAALNNNSTFLSLNSVDKLMTFNFKNGTRFTPKINQIQLFNFFKKPANTDIGALSLRLNSVLSDLHKSANLHLLNNSSSYSNFLSTINDNIDKKKISKPIFKLFNPKIKKKEFFNLFSVNKLNEMSDMLVVENNSNPENFFSNLAISFKTANTSSSNWAQSATDRYIRNFIKTSPRLASYNHSLNMNSVNDFLSFSNNSFGFSPSSFMDFSSSKWADISTAGRLTAVKTHFDYPYSPVCSNHPLIRAVDYDNLKNSLIEDMPSILVGKEELMPGFLMNIYWNFYWANSNIDWRFYNNKVYHSLHRSFYLPTFDFYYDYDFRNWQSLELLEDSFWESVYPSYIHDEYTTLADDFYEYEFFDKYDNRYNNLNRLFRFVDKVSDIPTFKDMDRTGDFYAGSLYIDDFITPSNLVTTKDYALFPVFSVNNYIDDSYEAAKYLNYMYNSAGKITLNVSDFGFRPHPISYIFDTFRADYDEFSWFADDSSRPDDWFKDFSFVAAKTFPNLWNKDFSVDYLSFVNKKPLLYLSRWFSNTDPFLFNFEMGVSNEKTLRFSNNINLRSSIRGAVVTYNAIQKVFRARFDENRSNAKLVDFSYSYGKQPLISSFRIPYEKILGKTRENYFRINFYKSNFQPLFNDLYSAGSGLNFYFYDFPFLLAMKSDASRYLWFDWFAKWGFYEIQPSSSSRYAIYGMPYFSKSFDFGPANSEVLTESETYLIRLSRARKNYMPNWMYTPYFYAKNSSWYRNSFFSQIVDISENPLVATQNVLKAMSWFWTKTYFIDCGDYRFRPSNSSTNGYNKLGWKPKHSIQSYYYSVTNLIDVLTKREFLYRELFSVNNKIINLPLYLTNNPSNPLLAEIKASFLFVDPIVFNNEYSRDVYFSSLSFFNYTILKSFLKSCNDFVNLSVITDFIFYYFFNDSLDNSLKNNAELYKSQYRPLRKGVTNMIRLHATGAVAMPTEVRLQILASSKDVIHSWAIPSAGIKIDCVPGYSSHKVMIFLVSGIFWGQCMEICGRYHHWMPIIVYFMKRDLFFLWCTHFVFLTGANNIWNINDRQFTDYVRLASFDKYSWLSEIND